MESFLIAAAAVALAEIGDKTQLLALVLAARFRRPLPIIAGMFIATLANHALAAGAGAAVSAWLGPEILRWVVGVSFLAMAVWVLIPDDPDDETAAARLQRGAFLSTLIGFFLAEMGDKTQIATVVLAARLHHIVPVVLGTTTGILLANVPVVLLGHLATGRIPLRAVHAVAALIFAVLGVLALVGVGEGAG